MALQGTLVNSRKEWNIEYLINIREQFLQQEYPLELINEQYRKVLQINRLDLLFKDPTIKNLRKKRKIIAPLIVTFSEANPPLKQWINQTITILHSNEDLKSVFPHISVVTRQNKCIRNRIMKNRYENSENKTNKITNKNTTPPSGNFKLHNKRCKVCERMIDGRTKWKINKTGRQYNIKRHYTCNTSNCIYLGECKLCPAQYIGQTTSTLQKRHYGHRQEVKGGLDGIGEHFHNHGIEKGLDINKDIDKIMEWLTLTIVASVEPDKPWTKKQLDNIEGDLQDRIMTFERHGVMNRR